VQKLLSKFIGKNIVIATALMLSYAVVTEGAVNRKATHDDWQSALITTASGSYARAITFRMDDGGELTTFNLDSPTSDCNIVFYTVNINLNEIQGSDLESPVLFGKFRVDRYPVHDITFTINIDEGEDFMSIRIDEWSKQKTVLKEIMSGNTARFQFKVAEKIYYYKFSLEGSREAMNRQDAICKEVGDDDGDFFEESEDDDESYFRT